MNEMPLHPAVVHLPIALGLLMPLIAGALALGVWRRWLPFRAWFIVVALQVVLVGSGMVALRTGEQEEERVEHVVAEELIEEHEEAAQAFVGVSAAVLALMVLAAGLGPSRYGLPVAGVATLGTVVALGLGFQAGHAGGSLVYEHGAAQAYGTTTRASAPAGAEQPSKRGSRHSDDDDDDD